MSPDIINHFGEGDFIHNSIFHVISLLTQSSDARQVISLANNFTSRCNFSNRVPRFSDVTERSAAKQNPLTRMINEPVHGNHAKPIFVVLGSCKNTHAQ